MKLIRFSAFAMLVTLTALSACSKEDPDAISMSEVNIGAKTFISKDSVEYFGVKMFSNLIWATSNVGATNPEESGSYYAWGETETKTTYDLVSYKWINDFNEVTKYADSHSVLALSDDAANVALGGNWHIPEPGDFNALVYFSDISFGKVNGVPGFLFVSKREGYEGNSIFLPFSGQMDLSRIKMGNDYGFYWTNQVSQTEPREASCLLLQHSDNDRHAVQPMSRIQGLTIRPVALEN